MGPSQTWKSDVKAQHKDCFCNINLISGSMPDVHVGVDRTSVSTVISMLIFYIYNNNKTMHIYRRFGNACTSTNSQGHLEVNIVQIQPSNIKRFLHEMSSSKSSRVLKTCE